MGAGSGGLTSSLQKEVPAPGWVPGRGPAQHPMSTSPARHTLRACGGPAFPATRGVCSYGPGAPGIVWLLVIRRPPRVPFTLWSVPTPTAKGALRPHFEQLRPKGRRPSKCGHRIWTQVSLVPSRTLSLLFHSSGEAVCEGRRDKSWVAPRSRGQADKAGVVVRVLMEALVGLDVGLHGGSDS